MLVIDASPNIEEDETEMLSRSEENDIKDVVIGEPECPAIDRFWSSWE